ncbi:uncharacterized protein [Dermacentor andersoni]|uniref:uncharacterized protein isoform X2 n=1 Tax=Dermacentor andersoni TaxID=34620 RepID=UPI003B3A937A
MARKCTLASSALALCILISLVDDSPEAQSGGVRMDFSPIYIKDQDITKVFRKVPYWWLFGFYIPLRETAENKRECVHFKKQEQNDTDILLKAFGGKGKQESNVWSKLQIAIFRKWHVFSFPSDGRGQRNRLPGSSQQFDCQQGSESCM